MWVALAWSAFGTVLFAVAGVRLPGLNFQNQRVEAAYRKELVYGEDDPTRAEPPTVRQLFANLQKNYFRLYFNYLYFNVVRYVYLQVDNFFILLFLGPAIRCRRRSPSGSSSRSPTPSIGSPARSSSSPIPGRRSSSCSRSAGVW